MLLLASGQTPAGQGGTDTIEELAAEVGVTSVWTVDLLDLLHKHGLVDASLSTTTVGVDHGMDDMAFYEAVIRDDEARVAALFERYCESGHVTKRTFPLSAILDELTRGTARFVVLVDLTTLRRKRGGVAAWGPALAQAVAGQPQCFVGHYILLVSMDAKGSDVLYLDPERAGLQRCSLSALDAARQAYGTDCDLIRVPRHAGRGGRAAGGAPRDASGVAPAHAPTAASTAARTPTAASGPTAGQLQDGTPGLR